MTTVRHTCGRRSGQSARALPHGPWPGSVGAILSADTHGASRRCRHQRARPVGPRPALESSWLRTCVFKQRPWGRWHLGHRTGVWGPRVCPQTPGGESGDGSPRLCPWAAPLAPAVLRRPQGRPRSPGPGRPGQLNISAGSQGRPGPPPPCTPSASPAVGSPVALWEQGAPQKGCMPPGQGWGVSAAAPAGGHGHHPGLAQPTLASLPGRAAETSCCPTGEWALLAVPWALAPRTSWNRDSHGSLVVRGAPGSPGVAPPPVSLPDWRHRRQTSMCVTLAHGVCLVQQLPVLTNSG